jgi:Luciferase-like monooxygenase
MPLPLEPKLSVRVQTIHRRTEPATGPWLPSIDEMRELVELVDHCGVDSLWVGDHISFPVAILDPLLQLAQAAVLSRRLVLGTAVYLLPLRHPAPVAKQVATRSAAAGIIIAQIANFLAIGLVLGLIAWIPEMVNGTHELCYRPKPINIAKSDANHAVSVTKERCDRAHFMRRERRDVLARPKPVCLAYISRDLFTPGLFVSQ